MKYNYSEKRILLRQGTLKWCVECDQDVGTNPWCKTCQIIKQQATKNKTVNERMEIEI